MAQIKTLKVAIIDYNDIKEIERLKSPKEIKLKDIEDISILDCNVIIFDNAYETVILQLPLT